MENMASLKTPRGWTSLGPAPRAHTLELTFAVKQTNTAKLEAALMNAADPDSPSYGAWLSNDAVHQLVAPAAVRHVAQLAVRTCGARRSLKEGVEARTGRLQLSHQGGRQGIRR